MTEQSGNAEEWMGCLKIKANEYRYKERKKRTVHKWHR